VHSASALESHFDNRSTLALFEAQAQGAMVGVVVMIIGMRMNYRILQRGIWWLMLGTLMLLVGTVVGPFATSFNGAKRWLDLGVATIQPAEVAKLMTAIYMAYSIAKKGRRMNRVVDSYVAHALAFIPFIVVLMFQPDFGSSIIICAIVAGMMFVGHARLSWMIGLIGALAVLAVWAIGSAEYRVDRLMVWMDPWSYALGEGWQLISGYIALAHGGIFGVGFGEGTARLGHVPELYNDFVAAAVGEEFGLAGMAALALAYVVFAWRGIAISRRATDSFGAYLAVGITMLVSLQATINLWVVTGLFPTKGLTLPFVSSGRSSLIVLMFAVGLLLNIAQANPDLASERKQLKERRALQRRHASIQADLAEEKRAEIEAHRRRVRGA
jgi:cell division protein FtsW